jgi:protein involved in polysaccharide export with SLBB domain
MGLKIILLPDCRPFCFHACSLAETLMPLREQRTTPRENRLSRVLQALAMAGGASPFADTKNIRVFRKAGNRTQIMNFNYNDVSAGKRLEQYVMLERGDVIVVP